MHWLARAAAVSFLAQAATAGEQEIEINNSYFLNQEIFELEDRIFLTQDNIGAFEVVKGPFRDGPARCLGSGFGFADGTSTIQGICIFGEGDDTFTMSWKAGEKGAANSWTMVDGTGRWHGIAGSGIATTDIAAAYRAMPLRQTHIIGTVTLPDG